MFSILCPVSMICSVCSISASVPPGQEGHGVGQCEDAGPESPGADVDVLLLIIPAPHGLYHAGAVFLPLAPKRARDGVIAGPVSLRRHLAQLRGLLHWVTLPSEEVLGEGVQDVHAVAEVATADGDVHGDDFVLIRFMYLQRRL